MKKAFVALLLSALTIVAATACQTEAGSTSEQATEASPTSEQTTEAEPATQQAAEADYSIVEVAGEPDWSSIPTLSIDHVLWTDDYGIRAEGQICHDSEYLYVHIQATEQDIRAENTEPLSPVYEDSCLEFFFMAEDTDKYFNFEINPNGCMNIQIGPNKEDRINLVRTDAQDYFDIHADRTSDGWEVFYRIPLVFIQYFYPNFAFEGNLKANMYKCGNETVHKHYLSWMPIDLDSPNFHCPEYFGTMRFES